MRCACFSLVNFGDCLPSVESQTHRIHSDGMMTFGPDSTAQRKPSRNKNVSYFCVTESAGGFSISTFSPFSLRSQLLTFPSSKPQLIQFSLGRHIPLQVMTNRS